MQTNMIKYSEACKKYERNPLGRITPDFLQFMYVSYTISLPEIKWFLNLDTEEQSLIYDALMDECIRRSKIFTCYTHTYELTKSCKVHVHGIIRCYREDHESCIAGCIADFAKLINRVLAGTIFKKTRQQFNPKHMFNNDFGVSYKCPMYKLDWIKDSDHYSKWAYYMTKEVKVDETTNISEASNITKIYF